MLRLKPHASISAPTASATLQHGRVDRRRHHFSSSSGLVDRGCSRVVTRTMPPPSGGSLPTIDVLLAAARDDLDDLALRQAARRPDRHARLAAALELARGDAEDRLDVDRDHELDADRARRARAADRRARPGRACGSSRRRSTRPGRARSTRTSGSSVVVANSRRARTGSIELRGTTTANCESPTLMPMSCGVTSSSAASSDSPARMPAYARGAERDDLVGVRALATASCRRSARPIVLHRRPPRHAADEQDLLDVGRGEPGVGERAHGTAPRADRADPWSAARRSSRVIVRS